MKLIELARECLERSDSKRDRALELMLERVHEDVSLRMSIEHEAIEIAARHALGQASRAFRASRSPKSARPGDASGLRAVASIAQTGAYGFELAPGLRLGDATRAKLEAFQRSAYKRVRYWQDMLAWSRQIIERMPAEPGVRVRDALRETELRQLMPDTLRQRIG